MAQPSLARERSWLFTTDSEDNSACSVSLAAASGARNTVGMVVFGYDLPPASGDRQLTIAWTLNGVAQTYTHPINGGGDTGAACVDMAVFPDFMLTGDENTAVTIGLTASGTAGNKGWVNVFYL